MVQCFIKTLTTKYNIAILYLQFFANISVTGDHRKKLFKYILLYIVFFIIFKAPQNKRKPGAHAINISGLLV